MAARFFPFLISRFFATLRFANAWPMESIYRVPLSEISGISAKSCKALADRLSIRSVADLLEYFPTGYQDRTRVTPIARVGNASRGVQLVGTLSRVNLVGAGRKMRLEAIFTDSTGSVTCVWFNRAQYIYKGLMVGKDYLLYGKPSIFRGMPTITHPEYCLYTENTPRLFGIVPQYEEPKELRKLGITSNIIRSFVAMAFRQYADSIVDPLPPSVMRTLRLPSRQWALHQMHCPESMENLPVARGRLAFDELFLFQMRLQRDSKRERVQYHGIPFPEVGTYFNRYYREFLPFSLTNAQKNVLRDVRRDTMSGRQMNRLLQGDVGSGKTMVALFSILLALDNGYQACLMAPTEILAQQHFLKIRKALAPLQLMVALLTGSTPAGERREIARLLLSGQLHLVIGTHALLEDWVEFAQLGLVVIDEQHRFGVNQRAKLWAKGPKGEIPHVLIMTATPIPRTLALTLYGDLDVSIIDELPPGRKPIATYHVYTAQINRVYRLMRAEIEKGRQVYMVFPLIEESESLDLQSLMAGYQEIQSIFQPPSYRIGLLHGKMPPAQKELVMAEFKAGETQILVSTTVIEVGVDVPNANIMVIHSAQRFGLSQLHQLRGRVGRGAEESYCILLTDYKLSETSRERLRTMVETQDGFKIAEADMRLRGVGDLAGTSQSGFTPLFRLASIQSDSKLVALAQRLAHDLLEDDPLLEKPENQLLSAFLEQSTPCASYERIG